MSDRERKVQVVNEMPYAGTNAVSFLRQVVQPGAKDLFSGIIFESGAFKIKDTSVARQMAMMLPNGEQLYAMLPEPAKTFEQMQQINVPILFIHGTADSIVPYSQVSSHNIMSVSGRGC